MVRRVEISRSGVYAMPSAKPATLRRILIIDDDRDFCTSTTALLESQGYAVSSVPNGKDGIARVRKERPDLVILDVMMEHAFAGYEVNQALKFASGAEEKAVPILMVSSVPLDPASRFAGAGEVEMVTPDGYLTKPLDIDKFLSTVRDLLKSRPG
jgi:DNA-binding response OmpR family regulator